MPGPATCVEQTDHSPGHGAPSANIVTTHLKCAPGPSLCVYQLYLGLHTQNKYEKREDYAICEDLFYNVIDDLHRQTDSFNKIIFTM